MKNNLNLSNNAFGFILIVQLLTSCNLKNSKNENNLNISFEYLPEGGNDISHFRSTDDEIIRTKENKDTIEISLYKLMGVPIDGYNGKCEMKSDTLYLYYWEEMKEINRNHDHAALILESQLKYKIRKTKYSHIKTEELNPKYIK